MNEQDLRDCFAMFALVGLVINCKEGSHMGSYAYELADQMLEARKPKDEEGIVAIKKRVRKK